MSRMSQAVPIHGLPVDPLSDSRRAPPATCAQRGTHARSVRAKPSILPTTPVACLMEGSDDNSRAPYRRDASLDGRHHRM
jgi:hypothetical protein